MRPNHLDQTKEMRTLGPLFVSFDPGLSLRLAPSLYVATSASSAERFLPTAVKRQPSENDGIKLTYCWPFVVRVVRLSAVTTVFGTLYTFIQLKQRRPMLPVVAVLSHGSPCVVTATLSSESPHGLCLMSESYVRQSLLPTAVAFRPGVMNSKPRDDWWCS